VNELRANKNHTPPSESTNLDREAILRILDVNFNRAAEGLRTLEDIARVVREDIAAAGWSKSLRHAVGQLASKLPRAERLAARSVESDSGTTHTHTAESTRASWNDLLAAASERVTQSLRVIEEAAKGEFAWLAAEAKQLRYQAYDQLAAIETRLTQSSRDFPAHALYLLLDCKLPLDQFSSTLVELASAGVGWFQIRDKQADAAVQLRYARAAVAAVGAEHVIVNDRVDIALASGASGVHVGQEDLPLSEVQRISRGRLWIGVSTHNIQQALQAVKEGADYIGCGPTFSSSTKQFEHFAGLAFLREIVQQSPIPAYAIGGIDHTNLPSVRAVGIHRIAVSGAILNHPNPPVAAASLSAALGNPLSPASKVQGTN
jgi:thiamine-phosphate pyrophosphorylase